MQLKSKLRKKKKKKENHSNKMHQVFLTYLKYKPGY